MRLYIVLLCAMLSFSAKATVRDSIGVENQNGTQVILHKVQPKETYYSIARLYNVSPKGIIQLNNNVGLQIGIIVKVPTNRPFSQKQDQPRNEVKNSSQNTAAASNDVIEYKVGPKEYLYSIAKRFNTTVEDIKQLNNLKGNNLSIGQIIKVRQGVGTEQIQPVHQPLPQPLGPSPIALPDTTAVEKPKIPTSRLGLSERSERGVAVWIADQSLDGSKMLALHRTAPIGTVVKITNPMTERATFAKVVGKFTENETTKDVIIVLTKATAELLGALDKRFQVTIDYGVPNE